MKINYNFRANIKSAPANCLCFKLFAAFLLTASLLGCVPRAEEKTVQTYAMNTVMSLTACGDNADAALNAAVNEINSIDRRMQRSNPEGEIYKLNSEKSAELSQDTAEIISTALDIADKTNGAFDITIAPVMDLWGFYGQNYHLPDKDELTAALADVDYKRVSMDGTSASLNGSTGIDLGGIAKGYTSDRLIKLFREKGITSAIVTLGGNVQTLGTKSDGSKWRVGIQNPDDSGSYIGIVSLENMAAVTSGGYQRYFERNGIKYHHIIDPETGYPADSGVKSVTIVCENGTLADGLSTSLFVMGLDKSTELWKSGCYSFDFVIQTEDNKIYITENIEDIFESDYDVNVVRRN